MARIYCLSTVDLDRVFEIDHLPSHDEKIFASRFHEGAGGQGVFVARALAALRAPVTFIGSVGDDLTGAALVAELEAVPGLAVDIRRFPGVPTGTCAILVDKSGEKAIVLAPIHSDLVTRLGEDLSVEPGDVVTANFFDPATIQRLFSRVRRQGGRSIIDIEITGIDIFSWEAAFETALSADFVCVNQTTLSAWCARSGRSGPLVEVAEAFAVALSGDKAASGNPDGGVCVTLGERGVLVYGGGATTHVPARPVKPMNTTGAGDTFLAGLAHGLVRGDSLVDAARFGTRVAADFLAHGAVDRARLDL